MIDDDDSTVKQFLWSVFGEKEAELWTCAVARPLLYMAYLQVNPYERDVIEGVTRSFFCYVVGEYEPLQPFCHFDLSKAPRGCGDNDIRARLRFFLDHYGWAS